MTGQRRDTNVGTGKEGGTGDGKGKWAGGQSKGLIN